MATSRKNSRAGVPLKAYGAFTRDGSEFVVTRPDTPRPWVNYLTNEDYCAIISQCGGGYSFFKDCRSDRIMRWKPANFQVDRPGRYLYLKETTGGRGRARPGSPERAGGAKGGSTVWSATYQPMKVTPDAFEARHGIGYTVIRSTLRQLESEVTFFVPRRDACEVWMVRLVNHSGRTRTLEAFPYVEWLLGDYHLELRYRNIMNLYNRVWYDPKDQIVFAKKTAAWGDMNIEPFPGTAFFASSLPATGSVTIKEAFLGRLRTEECPAMLTDGTFRHVPLCSGEDGIGLLRHRVTLRPKQAVEFTVMMGQNHTGEADAKRLIRKYRARGAAAKELAAVKREWSRRVIENVQIETPDTELNQFVNSWLKHEVFICNYWSRSPSFYHEGSGGRGYRDSCQDAEAVCLIDSKHTKGKILKIARLIRRDGTCAPGWSDTSGPAPHRPNKDHPTWLTSTVTGYIKETGDWSILEKSIPYLKDQWIKGWDEDLTWKGGAVQDGSGTLFEHLEGNLEFTFHDVGPHGFPRIGHADWNDALDAVGIKGKGETVWLAMALVRSLKLLAELAERTTRREKARRLRRQAEEMTARINRLTWDGDWYLYGYTDEGRPFGTKANREGKIYLNTQSWAILSGVADPARQKKLLKSVDRHLDGKHGLALFAPAYSTWDGSLGRISMFSEGTKENAAVFCHAATFMIVADVMAGRGTLAHQRMRAIMPNTQADYDLYKTEPFAFAEYLVGPDNPYRYGEGAFSWMTGTAGWFFMLATEWLVGVRRDFDGLRIDPCLPRHWKRVRVVRPFRGATYEIEIRNPHGLEKGELAITVDGKPLKGSVIPPHRDGRVHQVRVTMKRPVSRGTSRAPGRRVAASAAR